MKQTNAALIAACGIDCALCVAYQRAKRPCAGCNAEAGEKMGHCRTCAIRFCPKGTNLSGGRCGSCTSFPCRRIKTLDARYRGKYHMSPVENLCLIEKQGVEALVSLDNRRWRCKGCGELLCVHSDQCLHCGQPANPGGAAEG